MISGRNQQVSINVQPIGATVCLDGQKVGTTAAAPRNRAPCTPL